MVSDVNLHPYIVGEGAKVVAEAEAGGATGGGLKARLVASQ